MNTIYGKGTLEAPYTPIATLNGSGGGGSPYELPQATSSILGGVKANTVQQNGAATIDVLQNNGLLTLKAAGAGAAGGGSATNFGAVKGAAFESGQTYVNAAVINGEVKTYTPMATQNTLGGVKASPKSSDMTQAVGIDSVGKLWVPSGGGGGRVVIFPTSNSISAFITEHTIYIIGAPNVPLNVETTTNIWMTDNFVGWIDRDFPNITTYTYVTDPNPDIVTITIKKERHPMTGKIVYTPYIKRTSGEATQTYTNFIGYR